MKYPDQTGFSVRNLWNMKRFYTTYQQHKKLQALPAEISWTNNVIILDKTKTIEEKIKLPNENPSVGLILCRSKKDSVVRLTLSKTEKPIKISVYQTKLPDKKLIQQRLEKIKLPENY